MFALGKLLFCLGETPLGLGEAAFVLGEAAFEFITRGAAVPVRRSGGDRRGRGGRFGENAGGEEFLGLGEAFFEFGAAGDLAVEFGGERLGGGHAITLGPGGG